MREWQTAIAAGRIPEEGVLSGVLVLLGGVLLVTPGVLTDVVGILLLVPWTRRLAAKWIRKRVERGIARGNVSFQIFTGPGATRPRRADAAPRGVIDVEGETIDQHPVDADREPPRLT